MDYEKDVKNKHFYYFNGPFQSKNFEIKNRPQQPNGLDGGALSYLVVIGGDLCLKVVGSNPA